MHLLVEDVVLEDGIVESGICGKARKTARGEGQRAMGRFREMITQILKENRL